MLADVLTKVGCVKGQWQAEPSKQAHSERTGGPRDGQPARLG